MNVVLLSLYACGGQYKAPTAITAKDTGVLEVINDSSEEDTPPEEPDPEDPDFDGDGFPSSQDCDDSSPGIHPEADEICNELDDNCNNEIDEGAGDFWYVDADEDNYGGTVIQRSCEPIPGATTEDGDCDDANPEVFPGSPYLSDGADSDCDGVRDWKVGIHVAVDDDGILCINGNELGATGGWTTGQFYETWLPSGTHTVGIHGWDLGYTITAAIGHLEISDGTVWVTDDTWRYDPNPETVGKQGWCNTTFDDSGWDLVLDIGPIGDSSNPWGNAPSIFPVNSPAHWIWDHFPVNLNTQYLRKEFTLP